MNSADAGASLISAMVAVVLMTAAVGLAVTMVGSAVKATDEGITTLTRFTTLVRFDADVVGALSRIRQPPWLAGPAFLHSDGEIVLGYLDADPTRAVRIAWNADGTSIALADDKTHYRALVILDARFVVGPPAHLLLDVRGPDGSTLSVSAPLGSAPLPPP